MVLYFYSYFYLHCIFLFLEETAIAKGVRRIAGITGADAVKAQGRAAYLETRTKEVASRFKLNGILGDIDSDITHWRCVFTFFQNRHHLQLYRSADNKTCWPLYLLLFVWYLFILFYCRKQVEDAVISCVVKARLCATLEGLQKGVYAAKSKLLMERVDQQIISLKQVRRTNNGENRTFRGRDAFYS